MFSPPLIIRSLERSASHRDQLRSGHHWLQRVLTLDVEGSVGVANGEISSVEVSPCEGLGSRLLVLVVSCDAVRQYFVFTFCDGQGSPFITMFPEQNRRDVKNRRPSDERERTSHRDLSDLAPVEPHLLKVALLDLELLSLGNQAHDANVVRSEEGGSLTRLEGVVSGIGGVGEVLHAASASARTAVVEKVAHSASHRAVRLREAVDVRNVDAKLLQSLDENGSRCSASNRRLNVDLGRQRVTDDGELTAIQTRLVRGLSSWIERTHTVGAPL